MIALPVSLWLLLAPPAAPAALEAMVDTERAFAAAARVKGARDAFLEYFADEAILFTPFPEHAKTVLRRRPALPFSVLELHWEPRLGDVSASGDLGWLTGPTRLLDHRRPGLPAWHGNYLSVWRRGEDGVFRVIVDLGGSVPAPAEFVEGFQRFAVESRFAGSAEGAAESLRRGDRALNDALAREGPAAAFSRAAAASMRLHREDRSPVVGRERVVASFADPGQRLHAVTLQAEASAAGDVGYSFGTYRQETAASGTAETGAYLRIWTRDAAGTWQVAVDVGQPAAAEAHEAASN